MILITSAAYIDQEFRAEFGLMPPALLPIGNRRLIEHQVTALRKSFPNDDIFLSLPSDFELSTRDIHLFKILKISCITAPPNLSIGESIHSVIKKINKNEERLVILHGDTLINNIPSSVDIIGISRSRDYYPWEIERTENNDLLIWCGFFSFSSLMGFVKSLDISHNEFIKAIKIYTKIHGVQKQIINDWKDLGHINNYFKARSAITTERAFNSIIIDNSCVYKTGNDHNKIAAESNWYNNIPPQLKVFTPQLIDSGIRSDGSYFYIVEYLRNIPLNELYVHGKNGVYFWSRIFDHCEKWLYICKEQFNDNHLSSALINSRSYLLGEKNRHRINTFCKNENIDVERNLNINENKIPSIRTITEYCIEYAINMPIHWGILHGDFCFSNILYDSRADSIKVIDPRGLIDNNSFGIYGDLQYDIAKMTHSVIGLYDFIIAGDYVYSKSSAHDYFLKIQIDDRNNEIINSYINRRFLGISPSESIPLTILLFLSMLPLHSDNKNRQYALFANALRLFSEYINY